MAKLGDIYLERPNGDSITVRITRTGIYQVGPYGAASEPMSDTDVRFLRLCARTYQYSAELLRRLGYALDGTPDATPLTDVERQRLDTT